MFWKALDAFPTTRTTLGHGSGRVCERHGTHQELGLSSCLRISGTGGKVSLVGSGGGSSVRTGMGARVHFVSILCITLRVVGGGCVRDVECILLFITLQSTVSESSALESYGIFA